MNLQRYFGATLLLIGMAIVLGGLGVFLNQRAINPNKLYFLMFTWVDLLLAMSVGIGLIWAGGRLRKEVANPGPVEHSGNR